MGYFSSFSQPEGEPMVPPAPPGAGGFIYILKNLLYTLPLFRNSMKTGTTAAFLSVSIRLSPSHSVSYRHCGCPPPAPCIAPRQTYTHMSDKGLMQNRGE
jgi:hypothetical protein